MNPLVFFLLLLRASLFSTGGSGNLPILYQDLLARGWATEQQFAEALAIGQVTPGPTGLWVISLGYLTDGVRGALLAAVAITLPPLLALLINAAYRRWGGQPAVQGFVRGLSLAVVGVLIVVLSDLARSTGLDGPSVGIGAVSLALALSGRVPVSVLLALAAAAGIIVYAP